MLPMCSDEVRARLVPVLKACGLPYVPETVTDKEALLSALKHDKKTAGDKVHTVFVPTVGTFEMQDMTPEELVARLISIADIK